MGCAGARCYWSVIGSHQPFSPFPGGDERPADAPGVMLADPQEADPEGKPATPGPAAAWSGTLRPGRGNFAMDQNRLSKSGSHGYSPRW